jgi:hypothetical protein
MPVGQAVTATRVGRAAAGASPVGADGAVEDDAGEVDGAAGGAAAGAVPVGAGSSLRAPSTSATMSSGVGALRNAPTPEDIVAQRLHKLGLDQRPCELRQQLEVRLVRAVGSCDQKDQVSGAVRRTEVDGGVGASHGEGGLEYRGRAAVRNRDTAGDAGVGFLLAGPGVVVERLDVGGATGVDHTLSERADESFPGATEVHIQRYQLWGDE